MPLVASTKLPTFEQLRLEGENVVSHDTAVRQDIRELHVGLLNMMPDAALAATERQFFRLIGQSNQIAQFYVHPFTFKELPRSAEAEAYVAQYYETFDAIKAAEAPAPAGGRRQHALRRAAFTPLRHLARAVRSGGTAHSRGERRGGCTSGGKR